MQLAALKPYLNADVSTGLITDKLHSEIPSAAFNAADFYERANIDSRPNTAIVGNRFLVRTFAFRPTVVRTFAIRA